MLLTFDVKEVRIVLRDRKQNNMRFCQDEQSWFLSKIRFCISF